MNTTSEQIDRTAPALKPPGAGLPFPELYIAKLRFGYARWATTAKGFTSLFEQEQAEILRLVSQFNEGEGRRQVLIKRLRGMEDSSRNWSVFMTLNHLSMVNGGITQTIRHLVRGEVPDGTVSTADVKPSPASDSSSVDAFERVCSIYLKSLENIEDLKTKTRFRHPWFGPMDAFSWHALAAVHMQIHRRQIELIRDGIKGH